MRKEAGIRSFCCWSGGKESALSLHKALVLGLDVKFLVNMVNSTGRLSRSHGLHSKILTAQARSLGIPLLQEPTSWKLYEKRFKKVLSCMKEKGVEVGVFGDIDIEAHREWVKRVCKEIGITPVLPLWQRSRNNLMSSFMRNGFKAIIVVTRADILGKEWLGRRIDKQFTAELKQLKNVDLCGERGEYHTFVYDGPIFKKQLRFGVAGRYKRSNYWFLKVK